jgi:hypothetical protein
MYSLQCRKVDSLRAKKDSRLKRRRVFLTAQFAVRQEEPQLRGNKKGMESHKELIILEHLGQTIQVLYKIFIVPVLIK